MSHGDHQKVKSIFQLAAELAPEEREAFLDEECAGDDYLPRWAGSASMVMKRKIR